MKINGKHRVLRQYRLNSWVYEELKEMLEKLQITETSFVEIAIIEKMARIEAKKERDD